MTLAPHRYSVGTVLDSVAKLFPDFFRLHIVIDTFAAVRIADPELKSRRSVPELQREHVPGMVSGEGMV